jgi:DNA-binding MarR family transcriptional regulator
MSKITKSDLENQVFTLIREYGMSSVLLRNAVSRKLGLNITDMECLSLLAIRSVSTPTELARYTRMTTGAATVMLDRLERANLISRKPNPQDRRGTLIAVNNENMQKNASLFAGAQTKQREILADYTEPELKIIADFLAKISKAIASQADTIAGLGRFS